MDGDRTIVEFDEYSYEIWGTVRFCIYARDMTLAVERFNSLFDAEACKDYDVREGTSVLNPDNYEDIISIERTKYGKRDTNERLYEFKVFFKTYLRGYHDSGAYDRDEAKDQIMDESLFDGTIDFIKDGFEVIDTELIDIEYVGSGYFD